LPIPIFSQLPQSASNEASSLRMEELAAKHKVGGLCGLCGFGVILHEVFQRC
jgi:hypothetical protein